MRTNVSMGTEGRPNNGEKCRRYGSAKTSAPNVQAASAVNGHELVVAPPWR